VEAVRVDPREAQLKLEYTNETQKLLLCVSEFVVPLLTTSRLSAMTRSYTSRPSNYVTAASFTSVYTCMNTSAVDVTRSSFLLRLLHLTSSCQLTLNFPTRRGLSGAVTTVTKIIGHTFKAPAFFERVLRPINETQ